MRDYLRLFPLPFPRIDAAIRRPALVTLPARPLVNRRCRRA